MPGRIPVSIIVGSASDLEIVEGACEILKSFSIAYEISIVSAHRTPEKLELLVKSFARKGTELIIACAGLSAHLPGVVAAKTTLPVIGVPSDKGPLSGLDALLSIVQMPSGVPVACVSVGKTGAVNAGLLAVEILALKDKHLRVKLKKYRAEKAEEISRQDEKLKKVGLRNFLEKTDVIQKIRSGHRQSK